MHHSCGNPKLDDDAGLVTQQSVPPFATSLVFHYDLWTKRARWWPSPTSPPDRVLLCREAQRANEQVDSMAMLCTSASDFYAHHHLWINFRSFYIGVDFPSLANSDNLVLMMLQPSAKAYEIMIIASVSQIVWHAVRHELLYGEGLPLSLIGTGLLSATLTSISRRSLVALYAT